MAEYKIKDFESFWPFYLREHSHSKNRKLHWFGTLIGSILAISGLLNGSIWLIVSGIVAGYGAAWYGHFYIERNTPATFQYPLWSLRGDFRMFFLMTLGKMDKEFVKHNEKLAQIDYLVAEKKLT